jgi:hypothetical protein
MYVCRIPTLTIEFVEDNLDNMIFWEDIVENPLNYQQRYIDKIIKHLAAFRIQCHWRKCYYDPMYVLCKKRLDREYKELCAEAGCVE